MSPKRVVIDTNVFISAALNPYGTPRQVIDRVITKKLSILQSQATYRELTTRIAKKKFDRYVSNANRKLFLDMIKSKQLESHYLLEFWRST